MLSGGPKFGWLKMLKNSPRNRSANLFRKVKMPLKRDIGLPGSETPQHIASEIALLPGGRCGKSRRIESLAARILRAIEHKRHSGHHVRARIQRNAVRKTIPPTTSTGGADLAKMKLSTDQPPQRAWAICSIPARADCRSRRR